MNPSRQDRIRILAWTLPDALRSLTSRSTETRRFAPSVWQLCGTCNGDKHTTDRWGKHHPCTTCNAAGRTRTDPYADGLIVSSTEDRLETRTLKRRVPCDRCDTRGVIPGRPWGIEGYIRCPPPCDGTGHIEIPIADTQPLSGPASELDSVTWAFRGGDWDALDSSLERMKSNGARPLWRAFVASYIEPPYEYQDGGLAALDRIDRQMPSRIRVPAEVITAWKARTERQREATRKRTERMGRNHRNREIRTDYTLGHTIDDLARQYALTESQIRRIVYATK